MMLFMQVICILRALMMSKKEAAYLELFRHIVTIAPNIELEDFIAIFNVPRSVL